MKKKDDLETIVDLLYEWCREYDEDYATVSVLDGCGTGTISTTRPDYHNLYTFVDYKEMIQSEQNRMDPCGGNREEVQDKNSLAHP